MATASDIESHLGSTDTVELLKKYVIGNYNRYPVNLVRGEGSERLVRPTARGRPYKLVWHEERFESPDQLLVFVAGHEIWHFLCHSGQRRGDHETKANCNGFLWLAEFKRWAGPGHAVAPIPPLPPRPDRPCEPLRAVAVFSPPPAANPAVPPIPPRASTIEAGVAARIAGAEPSPNRGAASSRETVWTQGELFSGVAADRAAAPPPRPSHARRARRRENG